MTIEREVSDTAPSGAGERVDVAVVGAGAAGLMTAIQTARASGGRLSVVALDGARRLGAKILVAGGGRCNVTHHAVTPEDFDGASRAAIAKVLRAFPVEATVRFFAELGVDLVREPSGKLFPASNRAQTVLDALLAAATNAGVALRHPWRVTAIERQGDGFRLTGHAGDGDGIETLFARRVVLATGGRSLPKSGSDGGGYALATALGHTLTPAILPALVPLLLPADHPLVALSGIAAPVRLEVLSATGRRLTAVTGDLLCTHFGISGPAVLDVSRHWLTAQRADPGARLVASFAPGESSEQVEQALLALGPRSVGRFLAERFPDRLAETLARLAAVEPSTPGHRLPRDARRRLVTTLTALELPVRGDRGFAHAEVTAGGVPLAEVDPATMASRCCPGLSLVGEILDVDGRIGGFNFQWAWASGTVAGRALGRLGCEER